MKRFITIAIFCLMLLLIGAGDIYSYNPRDVVIQEEPVGDEHPWGGDQVDDGDPTYAHRDIDYLGSFTTTYPAIDLTAGVVNYFFKKFQPYFEEKHYSLQKYKIKKGKIYTYRKTRQAYFIEQR